MPAHGIRSRRSIISPFEPSGRGPTEALLLNTSDLKGTGREAALLCIFCTAPLTLPAWPKSSPAHNLIHSKSTSLTEPHLLIVLMRSDCTSLTGPHLLTSSCL